MLYIFGSCMKNALINATQEPDMFDFVRIKSLIFTKYFVTTSLTNAI